MFTVHDSQGHAIVRAINGMDAALVLTRGYPVAKYDGRVVWDVEKDLPPMLNAKGVTRTANTLEERASEIQDEYMPTPAQVERIAKALWGVFESRAWLQS